MRRRRCPLPAIGNRQENAVGLRPHAAQALGHRSGDLRCGKRAFEGVGSQENFHRFRSSRREEFSPPCHARFSTLSSDQRSRRLLQGHPNAQAKFSPARELFFRRKFRLHRPRSLSKRLDSSFPQAKFSPIFAYGAGCDEAWLRRLPMVVRGHRCSAESVRRGSELFFYCTGRHPAMQLFGKTLPPFSGEEFFAMRRWA